MFVDFVKLVDIDIVMVGFDICVDGEIGVFCCFVGVDEVNF